MKRAARAFVIAVLFVVCIGLGAYLVTRRQPPASPTPPPSPRDAKTPVEAPTTVKVYRIAVENDQPVLRAVEKEVKAGTDLVAAAIRRLIEQGDNGGLSNPIPKGTRLLGLKIENGLAAVDLSREFRDNFTGGSEAESMTIGAVLRTLSQFPEVKRVQFLIEGKPLDTLGHLDLSGPQDVEWVNSQSGGDS